MTNSDKMIDKNNHYFCYGSDYTYISDEPDDENIGRRFGNLTVLKRFGVRDCNGKKLIAYECKCDCGNKKSFIKGNLKNAKSCGCKNRSNLIGKKYGRLTVLKRLDDYISPKGWTDSMWECQCECGNVINVRGSCLRNKHTESCGCIKREQTIEFNKKTKSKINDFKYCNGGYYMVFTNNKDSYGRDYFFIDEEDYIKICCYCWFFDHNDYVVASNYNQETKKNSSVRLQRIILGLSKEDKQIVDHIRGCKTRNDNRKQNLRIVTRQQNCMNRKPVNKESCDLNGVTFDKTKEKWIAYIGLNGKQKFLGYFNSLEEAGHARFEAEEYYYGEYSYYNSQNIEEPLMILRR